MPKYDKNNNSDGLIMLVNQQEGLTETYALSASASQDTSISKNTADFTKDIQQSPGTRENYIGGEENNFFSYQ